MNETQPLTAATMKPTDPILHCVQDGRPFEHEDVAALVALFASKSGRSGPSHLLPYIYQIMSNMDRLARQAKGTEFWLDYKRIKYREAENDNPDRCIGEFYFETPSPE